MLMLKNKIIYENILTNLNFKYWIGAIFFITVGSFFWWKKIFWKLLCFLVKKKWTLLCNKYVESSQKNLTTTIGILNDIFQKSKYSFLLQRIYWKLTSKGSLKNWTLFFNLIVLGMVLNCLSSIRKCFAFNPCRYQFFVVSFNNLTYY